MSDQEMDQDVSDYCQSLNELVVNSKPHILMLTMLAEDYRDTKAREIVSAIEQRIVHGPLQHKLPALYLIDSICKNMTDSDYVRLFEHSIVKLFTTTFLKADEKTKILMYKLRQTWSDLFSTQTMHALDVSVSKIDPNWPVVAIQSGKCAQNGKKQSETVQPAAPAKQCPPPRFERVVLPVGAEVIGNEANNPTIVIAKTNVDPRKVKEEIKQEIIEETIRKEDYACNQTRKNDNNSVTRESAHNTKSNIDCERATAQAVPPQQQQQQLVPPRKRPSQAKPASIVVDHINANANNKKQSLTSVDLFSSTNTTRLAVAAAVGRVPPPSINKLAKIKKKKPSSEANSTLAVSRSPRKLNNHNKTKFETNYTARMKRKNSTGPSNVDVPSKQPRKALAQESMPLPVAPDDVIPLGKKLANSGPNWKPPLRSQISQSFKPSIRHNQSSSHTRKADNGAKPVTKTTIPAPNVFVQPEAVFGAARTTSNSTDFGGQDVDYRIMPTTNDRKPMVAEDMLVREGNRQLYEMNQLAQPPVIVPPPTTLPPAPVEPDSMVLFINDKAHRLYYVDNITALVLRNVHPDRSFDSLVDADSYQLDPRRVYFQGPPTTVFIDRGQPLEQSYRLEFNSPQACTFYLRGSPMPQTMMLGLPGRELVVNGRCYVLQFGSREPVRVFFDCDNMFHTFHLSDSNPSLQFSDEMRPDIWFQLVKQARAQSGLLPPPATSYNAFDVAPVSAGQYVPPSYGPPPPASVAPFPPYAPSVPPVSLPPAFDNSLAPAAAALPDINNLLSKLTEAGLISVTSASASSAATTVTTTKAEKAKSNRQAKREEKKAKQNRPRQYLPLDMKKLQETHEFAINQLYTGSRCTNCSLRFNDNESVGNGKKKTSYARHLDWHFRQNRREKCKPDGSVGSSSQSVCHRQPYYYALDLWILFKEVNDNAEDDSEEEKGNVVTSVATSTIDNFDFAKYRSNISDFDAFIDWITDNAANDASDTNKVCSVTADTNTKLNCCAVCNEQLEVKWDEDHEEWRCLNAVRYKQTEDLYDQPVASRVYHPFCLKDHLMQQPPPSQTESVPSESTTSTTANLSQSCID